MAEKCQYVTDQRKKIIKIFLWLGKVGKVLTRENKSVWAGRQYAWMIQCHVSSEAAVGKEKDEIDVSGLN